MKAKIKKLLPYINNLMQKDDAFAAPYHVTYHRGKCIILQAGIIQSITKPKAAFQWLQSLQIYYEGGVRK